MSAAWLQAATSLMGLKEDTSSGSNDTIIDWADEQGGWVSDYYKDDSIPWCGLFVAHCMHEAGLKGPKNPLSALAWGEWGNPTSPVEGAVLVFRRPGGGHVGFYVGENDLAYRVRGGNQSDAVSDTWVAKERLVAARWPNGVAVTGTKIVFNKSGSLSTNEA